MLINKACGADYTDLHDNPKFRRGRSIAPTADVSALRRFHDILLSV
jgi:hypothetical protein